MMLDFFEFGWLNDDVVVVVFFEFGWLNDVGFCFLSLDG